jgi:murein L,D-transpeptidase YcbB/YkuD
MRTAMTILSAALLSATASAGALAQNGSPNNAADNGTSRPSMSQPAMPHSNLNSTSSTSPITQSNSAPTMPKQQAAVQTGQNTSRQEVEQLQQALNHNGANIEADGVWGPRTSQALADYQQSHGLNASGILDSQTRGELGLSNGG